jgi:hypothetical protein
MANTCVFRLVVKGEGREVIKCIFEESALPFPWGCGWAIPGTEDVVSCQPAHGDGITVTPDAIIITGESKWQPPLRLILMLSEQYPELSFDVEGTDLVNAYIQRWLFQGGEGLLRDCVKGVCSEAYEAGEREETVYMRDGVQLLELPDWVPVVEKGMPG